MIKSSTWIAVNFAWILTYLKVSSLVTHSPGDGEADRNLFKWANHVPNKVL